MSSFPSFREFFEAVHGYEPFPWQTRLADLVVTQDRWPALLDLPTGTGKTTALDIGLYALAKSPRTMPRRIVLVVDRRIVVDQGAEHARKIRAKLRTASEWPLKPVADALRALFDAGPGESPFAVAVLRGGAPRDDDWAKRPDQPMLGLSTVDQVGSRLLFRGYGVGQRSASIHAGLMGNDTLILLDEVHLAKPFAETLQDLQDHYMTSHGGLPRRFHVVEMSATPGQQKTGTTFPLEADDHAHPVLAQRLGARKPARLVEVAVRGEEDSCRKKIAEAATEAALELRAAGARTVGVVVNRVDTARRVFNELKATANAGEVVLLTGRMRPLDRDQVVTERLKLAMAGRNREKFQPAFIVSTQCIEAGADLDFDALVTELASFDALKQRFGRLDRRGEVSSANGHASAIVLARSDALKDGASDPVYGTALKHTWDYLRALATNDAVDMGIQALAAQPVESSKLEQMIAPQRQAPVMMPGHVDAWVQTSPLLRPSPDPDVALWLHGPDAERADASVVWRSELTDEILAHWFDEKAQDWVDRRESIEETLTLVRPSSLEALPLPLWTARAWLDGKDEKRDVADVLGETAPDEDYRRRKGERALVALVRRDDRWVAVSSDLIRPGDMLIVPSSRGGIGPDSRCFDPESTQAVMDLGDLAQLRGRGIATLRTAAAAWAWTGAPTPPPDLDGELTARQQRVEIDDWLPTQAPAWFPIGDDQFERFREAITQARLTLVFEDLPKERGLVLTRQLARRSSDDIRDDWAAEATSEDDNSSFGRDRLSLQDHSDQVRGWAARFARTLGLPAEVARDLELAAWLHDVGKADPRFQLMLVGAQEVELRRADFTNRAKSNLPNMSGPKRRAIWKHARLPDGFRHELVSLALVETCDEVAKSAADLELVLHLVASHHGWCRPFAPAVPTSVDGVPLPDLELLHKPGAAEPAGTQLKVSEVNLRGSPDHSYGWLDGGVAARFWRLNAKYGPWGLAWLEAVLRLADHRASEWATEEKRHAR